LVQAAKPSFFGVESALCRGENRMISEQRTSFEPQPVERCSECGASLLVRDLDAAEVVCTSCGFVIATKLTSRGPEWRAFTPEQRREKVRIGAPYTFTIHDKGLSTKIDWRDIRSFSPEKKAQLHRLRRWQRRSRVSSSKERNLASVLSEMYRLSDALNLPKNVLETAAVIYRKAAKKQLTRGRSIQGMAVATVYLACRQCGLVRTIMELSQVSGIHRKDIALNYRILVRKLNYFVPPVKPRQYITRVCNQLEVHGRTEEVAHRILTGAKKLKLTIGRGPKGIAAAASYIASTITGERRTQREVAEAADLTEVTIRNRYKEMMKRLLIIASL
jgi:transcription initiation factor TFIIB